MDCIDGWDITRGESGEAFSVAPEAQQREGSQGSEIIMADGLAEVTGAGFLAQVRGIFC
jgi:hypothetical protein